MRIYIGVGGRFHADHMAEAFLESGADVHVFTSLPASRFQLPSEKIDSILIPEICFRLARKVRLNNWGDIYKMRSFGRTCAERIQKKAHPDFFFGWSSFSLESLQLKSAGTQVVVRDSAHIKFQNTILKNEYERLGFSYPDRTVPETRELEEYERADHILLPSRFAEESFLKEGVSKEKLKVVPLAVDTRVFSPPTDFEIKSPLKVIYFGALSIQKGVHHLLEATETFSPKTLTLTLLGGIDPPFEKILSRYSHARVLDSVDHKTLALILKEHHVFVFPTLHDGFGTTLPQAMASGLVPIVTENCGARDLVTDGVNGFRIRAGDGAMLRRRLIELSQDLKKTASLRERAAKSPSLRGWGEYAKDLREWIHFLEKSHPAKNRAGGPFS